ADLLRRQNEALLRDVAIGGGEAVRELRRETEDVAGALGEVPRQTEALRGSLQAQSHESTIIADRIAIEAQSIVTAFRSEAQFLAAATGKASLEAPQLAETPRR